MLVHHTIWFSRALYVVLNYYLKAFGSTSQRCEPQASDPPPTARVSLKEPPAYLVSDLERDMAPFIYIAAVI